MDYLKELYACNIDEDNIWCKCPFSKITHQFPNKSKSLLNSDDELFIQEDCNCPCGNSVVVNVGNYTDRISLQLNKKKTNYIVKKKSRNRLKLLQQLELEGRRTIRESSENDPPRKNGYICVFP